MITTAKTWACLGDSITFGHQSRGNIPYPQRLDMALFPPRAAANHGVPSDILSQMRTRYLAQIKTQGFYGIVIVGGVNDILADTSGAAAFVVWSDIANDALTAGLRVVGCTITPFKTYAGWNSGRQTQAEALNTAIRGFTHANYRGVDLYASFGDTDPQALKLSYQGLDTDGLHWGDGGWTQAAVMVAPQIITLTP